MTSASSASSMLIWALLFFGQTPLRTRGFAMLLLYVLFADAALVFASYSKEFTMITFSWGDRDMFKNRTNLDTFKTFSTLKIKTKTSEAVILAHFCFGKDQLWAESLFREVQNPVCCHLGSMHTCVASFLQFGICPSWLKPARFTLFITENKSQQISSHHDPQKLCVAIVINGPHSWLCWLKLPHSGPTMITLCLTQEQGLYHKFFNAVNSVVKHFLHFSQSWERIICCMKLQ